MLLLAVIYFGFMLVGTFVAIGLGLATELWSKTESIPVFLTAYCVALALAGKLAISLTVSRRRIVERIRRNWRAFSSGFR
jgi:hypothetical protein